MQAGGNRGRCGVMNCRICDGTSFGDVIDLGMMPLVNNLLHAPDDECPRWPLKAVYCRDCSLVQLTESPPPDLMFSDYCYFSSQSETMVEHARNLVERHVRPGQRVVEIASNDGYLLRHALELGAMVLGVDPAENIARYANERGVNTRCEYFNEQTAQQIRADWGEADVMFANNVLAHAYDPNEIAAGIKILLAAQGVAHIEVPYVVSLIESGAFDTIYHEHQCYFSVSALRRLFHRHDLKIVGVEAISIHGGSLHVTVAHGGDEDQADRLCEQEQALGLTGDSYYANFAANVQSIRTHLLAEIDRFESIGGYGAAAKAVVMLNYCGLDETRIPWVADVSPHKQNRYLPGTRQRVVAPEFLIEAKPEACVLFPWNIAEEITRRNSTYVEQGGRFIIPIPEGCVV